MEWQIVTVMVTLVGLFFTLGKPIIKLTSTIVKLDGTCERLEGQFEGFEAHNRESHRRIWAHNEEQDETLNNHENRINLLERNEAR